jgi:hypothetical protein
MIMAKILTTAIAAAACLATAYTASEAVVVGLPIFTTAPGSVSVVNEFQSNYPSSFYSLSYSGTIASAQGAPELVGQTISFHFSTLELHASLTIGGVNVTPFSGFNAFNDESFDIRPPEDFICDPSGNCTETYTGIFVGFNPVPVSGPSVDLLFTLSSLLPTRTGYFFCYDDNAADCTQVTDPTITEMGGRTGFVVNQSYIEGTLPNPQLAFS